MVHLAPIPNDKEVDKDPLVDGMKKIKFPEPTENEMSTSVYGSHFATQDLPKTEMPEREMPKDIAYKMIKLVGNPCRTLQYLDDDGVTRSLYIHGSGMN